MPTPDAPAGGASTIDLFIVNSIEFHTGKNPISDKPRIAPGRGAGDVVAPDGTRVTADQRTDGSVEIRVIDAKGQEQQVRLVPVPGGVEAQDADANAVGRVPALTRSSAQSGFGTTF